MTPNNEIRPCATDKHWDTLSLEQKVEVLAEWAGLTTEWMEKTHTWQGNVKKVMDAFDYSAHEIISVIKPFTGKGTNGGPPPPKKPKDPNC